MKSALRFLREERGQDLIEYTLLLACIAFASMAVFLGIGGSINGMWGAADKTLNSAANPAH